MTARVDRGARARAGTSRSRVNAPAARERAASAPQPRITVAPAAPSRVLAKYGFHARWLGDLVLVVTEDDALRRSLGHALATQGYRAVDGTLSENTERLVGRIQPRLILIDLDRRSGDGLAFLVRLREASNDTPVIALSSRGGEGDKVTALDVGADDYLTKPFGTSELLARMRVALRRARPPAPPIEVIEIGPIRIDLSRYEVAVNGASVHLTPIEFRLLGLFAQHAGKALSRSELLRGVWGADTDQAHHLRVHIAALRQKIEQDPAHPRWLVTVTGVGYRLRDD